MNFKLVRDIDRQALEEWPAWGQYYKLGDVDLLAKFGYERTIVVAAIEAVGWSDDYWFPIPHEAPVGTFEFEHRRALFHTKDGIEIQGYVYNFGHSIGLFGRRETWIINDSLLDLFEEERSAILEDLQINPEADLLPLRFDIEALGGLRFFPHNKGEQYGRFAELNG